MAKQGVDRWRQEAASPEEQARIEREVRHTLAAMRGRPSDDDLPEGEVLPDESLATVAYGLRKAGA